MSVLGVTDGPPEWASGLFDAGVKLASDGGPEVSYALSGTLHMSASGWLLLTVPNALVRGLFSAMTEPGVELPPPGPDGRFNAHVSVMTPADVAQAGGADKISERGKQFGYTVGRLYSTDASAWPGVSKVWFLRVHSPGLRLLRQSYGLDPLPGGNQDFHVSVAVRRVGVLGRNGSKKS